MTPKTVEVHLSNAYRKLGISLPPRARARAPLGAPAANPWGGGLGAASMCARTPPRMLGDADQRHLDRVRLVRPGGPGWDDARGTFNLLDDQRPEAIAFPADEREVAAVVAYARERGLRVAPQATGHNAAPLGSLEGTLILNTSALTGIAIDVAARRVRVGAATRWEDVTPRLSELGLACLHGSSPDVGIVGYSLGGGDRLAGPQARPADQRRDRDRARHRGRSPRAHRRRPRARAVLGAARRRRELRRRDRARVRGLPVRELYAGALFFGFERAAEVLRTWTALLDGLPEEITSWANVITSRRCRRSRRRCAGARSRWSTRRSWARRRDGRELLAPLRALGPELDTFAMQPPAALGDWRWTRATRSPTAARTRCSTSCRTPRSTIARIAVPGSPVALVQLRHMGGALARHTPGAGARATLPGRICMMRSRSARHGGARRDRGGLRSHAAGVYPNFVEQPADAAGFFDAETWARLRAAKALYDPATSSRPTTGCRHEPALLTSPPWPACSWPPTPRTPAPSCTTPTATSSSTPLPARPTPCSCSPATAARWSSTTPPRRCRRGTTSCAQISDSMVECVAGAYVHAVARRPQRPRGRRPVLHRRRLRLRRGRRRPAHRRARGQWARRRPGQRQAHRRRRP